MANGTNTNLSTQIKYIQANPFYENLHKYKDAIADAEIKTHIGDVKTVIELYKRVQVLFDHVIAYINKNNPSETENMRNYLNATYDDLINTQRLNEATSTNNIKLVKNNLRIIIENLRRQKQNLFILIVSAGIEVPMYSYNPNHASQKSDI